MNIQHEIVEVNSPLPPRRRPVAYTNHDADLVTQVRADTTVTHLSLLSPCDNSEWPSTELLDLITEF